MGSVWGYMPAARDKAAAVIQDRVAAHDAIAAPVIAELRAVWTCRGCGVASTLKGRILRCGDCGAWGRTRRTPWPAVAKALIERGIDPPRYGGTWHVSAVRRIAARNDIP